MIELTSLTKILITLLLIYIVVKTGIYNNVFGFVFDITSKSYKSLVKGNGYRVEDGKRKNFISRKLKNIKYDDEI